MEQSDLDAEMTEVNTLLQSPRIVVVALYTVAVVLAVAVLDSPNVVLTAPFDHPYDSIPLD